MCTALNLVLPQDGGSEDHSAVLSSPAESMLSDEEILDQNKDCQDVLKSTKTEGRVLLFIPYDVHIQ